MTKQYDAIQDCSHFQRIAVTYLGTLFVGKYTAEDLLHDLYEMLDTIHLRRDSVIIFGLDWAIIKLQDYLDQKYKRLIEVGTYLFYIITITLLRRLANFISIIVYRFE